MIGQPAGDEGTEDDEDETVPTALALEHGAAEAVDDGGVAEYDDEEGQQEA